MEYNITYQSNESNESNDSLGYVLRPIGYFYTTTFTTTQPPSLIERLLNNGQSSLRSSFQASYLSNLYEQEQEHDNDNNNENTFNISSRNTNLYYNQMIFNTDTNVNNENNENNDETYYDIFFPTANIIERIFNDYIENKNKLNDDDYKSNVEKMHEILQECPVCFTPSETTIKIKKCNHVFCEDCIQKWLKNHKNTCPICRVNVKIEHEQINDNN